MESLNSDLLEGSEKQDADSTGDVLEGEDEGESLAELKLRIEAMEQEVQNIEQTTSPKLDEDEVSTSQSNTPLYTGEDADHRSCYVGNVDYSTKPDELKNLFKECGVIQRITILCDRWTGQPKGFAYIQFATINAVDNAVLLDGSEFKNRVLKVNKKRTNVPGFGRGRGRGGYRGRGGGYRGRRGRYRGRSRYGGYRSRRSHYQPY